ncbi:Proteasome activator complex subunit 3 [Borealophlyctis nickersoniae]|nr:Proteasome activator complex subunit 3 [Borealophlyctis nickersoniae]
MNRDSLLPLQNEEGNLKKAFNEYLDTVQRDAYHIVHVRFPQKILEVRRLISTFPTTPPTEDIIPCEYNEENEYKATKKRKATCGGDEEQGNGSLVAGNDMVSLQEIPSNRNLLGLVKMIKPELSKMVELCSCVKSWMQFVAVSTNKPNNSGSNSSEELIRELSAAEDSAFTVVDSISRYHISRAKLATRVLKYPGVLDYREAIRELDEVHWLHLRMAITDVVTNCQYRLKRIAVF